MTREEAIQILRDTPIDIRSTREDDIHTLYATAQMMAIEALSADAVSREEYDALRKDYNAIYEATKSLCDKLLGNYTEALLEPSKVDFRTDKSANIGTEVNDLISRADVIKTLIRMCAPICDYQINVIEAIHALPSADRPQGEWEIEQDDDGIYGNCSICGNDADFEHYRKPYNYCPNCGARMEATK